MGQHAATRNSRNALAGDAKRAPGLVLLELDDVSERKQMSRSPAMPRFCKSDGPIDLRFRAVMSLAKRRSSVDSRREGAMTRLFPG
jgi:hypothetical protein